MADAQLLPYGHVVPLAASLPSFTSFTLNGTTDQLEWIFEVKEAATITRLGFRITTKTGTMPIFRVSLQGVDASGNPDGVIKGGGSPASATFDATAWSASTWHWVTLTNSYAAVRGEMLAMVIDYSSGTIDVSNSLSIAHSSSVVSCRFPYAIQNDATVRTRQTNYALFGYGSAGTAYGRPFLTSANQNFNSGSSPDEQGWKFTVPSGWCSTYQVIGIRCPFAVPAGTTVVLALYSGTDATAANSTGAVTEVTVQQNVTLDTDFVSLNANAGPIEIFFDESSLVTLYAGATYRITLTPGSATNMTVISFDVDAAADFEALPAGQNVSFTGRTDAGNWTDTTTRRLLGQILLADLTKPAAGGGGLMLNPGLRGGLN